jgi:hypothetical protein
MADDEHWYAHWEQGSFWEYGEGYGLRLRREVHGVVAWRNLTRDEQRWVRQQRGASTPHRDARAPRA